MGTNSIAPPPVEEGAGDDALAVPDDLFVPDERFDLANPDTLSAYLAEVARERGPVFTVRAFEMYMTIIVGPLAYDVLTRGTSEVTVTTAFAALEEHVGFPLFFARDGQKHEEGRRAIAGGTSPKMLLNPPRLAFVLRTLEETLDGLVGRGEVDVTPVVGAMVTRHLGMLCTGVDATGLEDDMRVYMDTLLGLMAGVPVTAFPDFPAARARAIAWFERILDRPLEESADRKDLVDGVQGLLGKGYTRRDVLGHVSVAFLAGIDTVTHLIVPALHHVLSDPPLLEAVRKEAAALDTSEPSRFIRGLTHDCVMLRRAISETLRRTPSLPIVGRMAASDITVGDRRIPQGRILLFAVGATHLDEAVYPAPDVFDPGRFAGHVPKETYLPFSAGRHHCPAGALGELYASLVLAGLVKYDVESVSGALSCRAPMPYRIVVRGRRAR